LIEPDSHFILRCYNITYAPFCQIGVGEWREPSVVHGCTLVSASISCNRSDQDSSGFWPRLEATGGVQYLGQHSHVPGSDQKDVRGPQNPINRPVDRRLAVQRLIKVGVVGLDGDERVSPMLLRPWPDALLGVPVHARRVNMVHTVFQQQLKNPIHLSLRSLAQGIRAKSDSCARVSSAAESLPGNNLLPPTPTSCRQNLLLSSGAGSTLPLPWVAVLPRTSTVQPPQAGLAAVRDTLVRVRQSQMPSWMARAPHMGVMK
jgi:hypothetical protein